MLEGNPPLYHSGEIAISGKGTRFAEHGGIVAQRFPATFLEFVAGDFKRRICQAAAYCGL